MELVEHLLDLSALITVRRGLLSASRHVCVAVAAHRNHDPPLEALTHLGLHVLLCELRAAAQHDNGRKVTLRPLAGDLLVRVDGALLVRSHRCHRSSPDPWITPRW